MNEVSRIHRVYATLFEFIEAELPLVQEQLTALRKEHPRFANYQSYKGMMTLAQAIGFGHVTLDGDPVQDLRAMEHFLANKRKH